MKIKSKMKALFSLCLSLIIICMCVLPSLGAVTYPENVTRAQTVVSIDKTDAAIAGVLEEMQNTTLKEMLLPYLYGDGVLSSLLTSLYSMIEEKAGSTLVSVGINASVDAVSKNLKSYGNVSQELSRYSSWSEVNLDNAQWGVETKEEFASAVSDMFACFDEVLYALLCGETYHINPIVSFKGSNGYEAAIIPTLESLGCEHITEAELFYSEAEKDKGNMMYYIVYDLLTMAEDVCDAPCNRLTEILPSIAYYLTNGGFDNAVSTLVEPLRLQAFNIPTIITIEGLSEFISDSESYTQSFTLNFNDIIAGTGFKMAPVDLNLLASCGTVSENKVIADKADTFIIVLRWLVDTLKLYKDSVNELLPDIDGDTAEIIKTVLSKETDSLVSLFISLFNQFEGKINNYQWNFKEFVPAAISYTPNLTAEKYQRVADNVDDLLDALVAESGEEKSLKSLLKKEIYSPKALTAVLKGLFSVLEGEDVKAVLSILKIDISPSSVADVLYSEGFRSAASSLRRFSSWSNVGEDGINWGFDKGNKRQFKKAIICALSPFEDALGMLLAEDKIELFGAVDIYGSNGYNTAIIPVYEALGCEASTIKTYDEYKKLYYGGKGVEALLDPIFSLLDRIIKKPVYTIFQILPNALYFLDGGLVTCIENLIYPFNDLITELGLEGVINFDSFKQIDIKQTINELIASLDLGIALPAIDVNLIASLGTQVQMTSKRTVDGQFALVPYIQADMPALSVTLMRIVASAVKAPGNEELINSLLETGMGEAADETGGLLTGFLDGIIEDLNNMTEDEAAEWFYKLLFRERVTDPTVGQQDEYVPTVIYKPKKDYASAVTGIAVVAAAAVLVFINRKKLKLLLESLKKEENNQEM